MDIASILHMNGKIINDCTKGEFPIQDMFTKLSIYFKNIYLNVTVFVIHL